MTINERISYAQGRIDEAVRTNSEESVIFWKGYRAGLEVCLKDLMRDQACEERKQWEEE